MILRTANADYDWQASFKAPKMDKGGMTVDEEATKTVPFGEGQKEAKVITLSVPEEDSARQEVLLHAVGLRSRRRPVHLARRGIQHVSEPMRAPLREALLKAQKG